MAAQLIFDGDSIMTVEYPWNNPAWFAVERLCRAGYDIGHARSVAVAGQTVADMAADAASQVDALYSGSYSANILVVLGGTNDIATAGGASATTLITRLSDYCAARQAAGWSVIVSTLLPRSDSGAGVNHESRRATVNASIVANYASYADVLADLAADPTIGESGDEASKDYYSDHLHPSRNGWEVIAGIWVPLIVGLL